MTKCYLERVCSFCQSCVSLEQKFLPRPTWRKAHYLAPIARAPYVVHEIRVTFRWNELYKRVWLNCPVYVLPSVSIHPPANCCHLFFFFPPVLCVRLDLTPPPLQSLVLFDSLESKNLREQFHDIFKLLHRKTHLCSISFSFYLPSVEV